MFVLGRVSGMLSGCFLVAFGDLLRAFWEPLGSPLGDFWLTFAALGVAFETLVGLWAFWVALGRTCKVFGEFLARFSTFLINDGKRCHSAGRYN